MSQNSDIISGDKEPETTTVPRKLSREEKRAQALRDNLKKRKQQKKEQSSK